MRAEHRSGAGPGSAKGARDGQTTEAGSTGTCRAFTLEERMEEELVNRFERKATDHQRPQPEQSEASHHHGLAAAFEAVTPWVRCSTKQPNGRG